MATLFQLFYELEEADSDRRYDIASDPTTPSGIQDVLAEDEDANVRIALASNPNLNQHTLERLLEDEDPDVHLSAISNPNTSEEKLEAYLAGAPVEVAAVARNPRLPDDLALRIINEDDRILRWILAQNTHLTIDVVHLFTYDTDEAVQACLAERTSIPWTGEASAQFLAVHQVQAFLTLTKEVDQEALTALLPTWQGSLATLMHAVGLTQR